MLSTIKRSPDKILFFIFLLVSNNLVAQNLLPKPDQLNLLQRDTSNYYFKEIWILSKDVNLNDAGGFLKRATDKMDLGYFKEARKDIEKSLSIDSTLSYGHFLKGFIMFRMDSLDAALADFKKATEYNDTNVLNLYYSAEVYSRKGRTHEADSLYNRVLSINKKFGEAHFGLANLSMMKGDLQKAEKEYKKTIELNPGNSFAYLNLAILYSFSDPVRSLKFIDKSITINPSFASAYFLRGCLNISKGNIHETLNDWKIAIDLDSLNNGFRLARSFLYINKNFYNDGINDLVHVMKSIGSKNYSGDFEASPKIQMANDFISQVNTYRNYSRYLTFSEQNEVMRGLCLFVLEKNNDSETCYENLLNHSTCPGLIHYLRGFNFESLHQPDFALNSYENAIKENIFPPEVYLRQGITLFGQMKYKDAIHSFSVFLRTNDSIKYAYRARANAYVQISNYDSAILDYNKFLGIDSTRADIYVSRAFCYKSLENYRKAILDYSHVLEHNPYDIESAAQMSVCEYFSGDTIGAYNLLNKTYDNAGYLTETGYYLLGTINLLKRQYESAIEHFSNAILINPKNIDALIYRGLAYYSIEEFKKSKADLTAALKINNVEITALYTRGLVNIKLNKPDEAYEDLKRADLFGHPLAKRAIETYLKAYKQKNNIN